MNGVVDVSGGVVSHLGLHAGRKFFFDLLELDPNALDHVDRVRIWQNKNPHEDRFLTGEAHFGVVVLRAEHDVRNVAQSDQCALVLLDHELFELIGGMQICVRGQVDLKQRAFGISDRGQEIIFRQRITNVGRRNV